MKLLFNVSEEQKPNGENQEAWVMPEPIFRSSEGRNLRAKEIDHDPQADLTTEPIGFRTGEISMSGTSKQSVRVKEDSIQRHKKKKRGCAKFFGVLAILIGLVVGVIIAAVIYFLFYYRPAGNTF